jgi:purine-binding chemotaxis protein CheW
MAMIKDLAQVNADLQEQKERVDLVDFKMITFSLGGKDYGVDIMNVKEIAKADKFTYVPNAASFVRGVYNLRGDIIPVVDLRTFFHLSADRKTDGQENMLILRIQERVYGTIVDKIDKVVGIQSDAIQPPHPIFGDINIKFIEGVVEKEGALYIILDVIRIFTPNEEDKNKRGLPESGGDNYYAPPPPREEAPGPQLQAQFSDALHFIKESLPTLRRFYPSSVNEEWLDKRFREWSSTREEENLQLKGTSDADDFLAAFFSPGTGRFWDEDYADLVKKALPDLPSNSIQVWNLGCGKGYETYSFVCILKSRFPNARIKIWANDSDIMAISQAPNMIFDLEEMPEYCRSFMVRGKNGYSFSQAVRDAVVFEYHDVLNDNPLPELDIILARDILSYLEPSDQKRIIADFSEKLKGRGIVLPGRNEKLPGGEWRSFGIDPVSAYMKN